MAAVGVPSGESQTLRAVAGEARRLIVQSVHRAQAGHLGGPLSAVDVLVALYFQILRVDPARPDWPERDRFILSKGHSCIALYVVLALRGYFPLEELATFDAINSRLQGHPDMTALPALDMSTGSLGQGLSPGIGMALGARRRGLGFRTYVMLGDGELQEGQVWEAAFVAARYGLENLVAIVDHNRLPQYSWPAEDEGRLLYQPEIAARWAAFGWRVLEMDGHDLDEIGETLAYAGEQVDGRPTVVIAHTVKGKGVSFMENAFAWHARPLTDAERDQALAELTEGARP
ncbi:MAG TPA: transketolase [Chloroflexota bacterium]|nr:transketolase [Chloroflexota bacterium]